MGLMEEAIAATEHNRFRPCDVLLACEQHPKLAAEIRATIANRKVSEGAAAATFAKHGIQIPDFTIGRHRRNQCAACRRNAG